MSAWLRQRPDLLPSFGLALGAVLWGLFWIPLRGVQDAGVAAVWVGPLVFAGATALFLPLALRRWRRLLREGAALLVAALLAGLAFSLYSVSLLTTDVVRALLLFYISPLWSTLLGILVLQERLTLNRIVALVLSFAGLLIVLGAGVQFPWPRNLGDWLALLSGLCWSLASVRLFQGGATRLFEKIFLFAACAFATSLMLALLPLGIDNAWPAPGALRSAAGWIALVVMLMVPIAWLTIWPTTLLSPARAGMLLMGELVVGVASAAVLTDEPFGTRELLGTLAIAGAACVEVARQQTIAPGGRGGAN